MDNTEGDKERGLKIAMTTSVVYPTWDAVGFDQIRSLFYTKSGQTDWERLRATRTEQTKHYSWISTKSLTNVIRKTDIVTNGNY